MNTPIRTRLRARLASCLAVISAAGMMLVGLPAAPAQAAPGDTAQITTGKRCDEMHLGKKYPRTPANSGAPGGAQFEESWPGLEEKYFYDHLFKGFEDVPTPTAQELAQLGSTQEDVDAWDKKYARSKDPDDMKQGIYTRYNRYLKGGTGARLPFKRWQKRFLTQNQQNNRKGAAFERKTVRDFNLVGPDWLCEVTVEVRDQNGKVIARRKYDAYNAKKDQFAEFKSTSKYRPKQYAADRIVLRHKDATYDFTKKNLVIYGGEKAAKGTVNQYGKLNQALRGERGTTGNPVRIYERRATGMGVYPTTKYSKYYPVMNPNPARGTAGPMNDIAFGSGRNLNDAKRIQREFNQANTRSALGRGPGGVDFTTLEIQYVGNPVKGKGLDYSFKADYVDDEDTNPGYGGQAKLQLASDAMFTWLALDPRSFWVNLNPDQPDKIMDPTFGKTDAGRVLLVADLDMKHDYARAMDPRVEPGKTYWDAMSDVGLPCSHSLRNWIVPKAAKVRVDENGIYILDAPLEVKSAPIDFTTPSPNGDCSLTKEQVQTSQRLVDQYILPGIERKINEDPKYADLRRVYKSRVAAEYIRRQDKDHPTDFHAIIGSGDVKRWPLRAPNTGWTPKKTYDEYVTSFTKGDYSYPCEYNGENKTCVMGGVDFSKQPEKKISRARFQAERPRLDVTTKNSVRTETGYRDTYTAYLGGSSSGNTDNGGTPEPDPSPTGRPTHKPGSPAPEPSDSHSGGPTPTPITPPGKNDDDHGGGLADTGAQVGLVAGIAAVLVAVGFVLARVKRRRGTRD
ncbi:hypothetical protein [Streptomyces sp. NPDC001165]|uniref:hypothetical protein n=1 Tax=Streptomyces sp. NPDC001165 TaxID=3364546 RepID=UPI0036898770